MREPRRRIADSRAGACAALLGLALLSACRSLLQIEELELRDEALPAAAAHGGEGGADASELGDGGRDARSAPVEPHASCRDLAEHCGPSGLTTCCAVGNVPGGDFDRANDLTAPASVSAFGLDRFEVTVGRFRRFVDAGYGTRARPPAPGAGAHPAIADSGWNPAWDWYLPSDTAALRRQIACKDELPLWTDSPGDRESAPMTCLDWYVSFAFCAWDGGRLATEAEWNYAAAGGDEQRPYPWGKDEPDVEHASYACLADGLPECSLGDLRTVGSFPAGDARWGHADLAGGMFEWTVDSFAEFSTPCTDCALFVSGSEHVLRGGSYASGASVLRNTHRRAAPPEESSSNVGLRCARPSAD